MNPQNLCDIRKDIAEQVVGYNNVELLGPPYQLHAARIRQHVFELDVLELTRMHLGHHLIPQHARFHDVSFFHGCDLVAPLARKFASDTADALDLIGVVNLCVDRALSIAEIGDRLGSPK